MDGRAARAGAGVRAERSLVGVLGVAALDLVTVLAFAAIGRRAHEEGNALVGVLETAWPFLLGAAVGWVVSRCWRRPAALRSGLVVWACTWAIGMVARQLTGQGTAPSFLVVAAIALAVLMLGWRLVLRWVTPRAGRPNGRRDG